MTPPAGYVAGKKPCRICGRISDDRYQPVFQVKDRQIRACSYEHAVLINDGKILMEHK